MKFSAFLRDKLVPLLISLLAILLIAALLFAFKIEPFIVLTIIIILLVATFTIFLIEYFRRRAFYRQLFNHLKSLDQAYLATEIIQEPAFLDGKLLYDALRLVDKSMLEQVELAKAQSQSFQDYIEMWVHEIKRPLTSLNLLLQNRKSARNSAKMTALLCQLENYVNQVLYFVRCENASEDYLIKPVNLDFVVKKVLISNVTDLLENHIEIVTQNLDQTVETDAKWLEFIINQIINNSVKYRRTKNAKIELSARQNPTGVSLTIQDNGIGISPSDLPQVFKKTFTGFNGRKRSSSTGMGLYIAQNLCQKLGHQITIDSRKGHWTKVVIQFGEHDFFDVAN